MREVPFYPKSYVSFPTALSEVYAKNIVDLRVGLFYTGLNMRKKIELVERPEADGATVVIFNHTDCKSGVQRVLWIGGVSHIGSEEMKPHLAPLSPWMDGD